MAQHVLHHEQRLVHALVTFGDAMVTTVNYTTVIERDTTFKLALKSTKAVHRDYQPHAIKNLEVSCIKANSPTCRITHMAITKYVWFIRRPHLRSGG